MLFDNLSPKTDFSSKITIQLDILMKNVLYCTHELDKIKKLCNKILVDRDLQKTVDEYFDSEDKSLDPETSPQTDSDEQ